MQTYKNSVWQQNFTSGETLIAQSPQKALRAFNYALKHAKTDEEKRETLQMLAVCFAALRNQPEAERCMTEFLDLATKMHGEGSWQHSVALSEVGLLKQQTLGREESMKLLDKAIDQLKKLSSAGDEKSDADVSMPFLFKAEVVHAAGDHEAAEQILLEAVAQSERLKLIPIGSLGHLHAYYTNKGDSEKETETRQKYISALERFLELESDTARAGEVRATLAELNGR